jgi:cytochrome c5
MRRFVPALLIAAIVIAGAAAARAQGAPPPAALPLGEGRDMLATACTQCHTLNMVTRGAQLTAREADTVIAYLAANFGPTAPTATAVKVTLPGGPGKELVEARCTACHDLERVAAVKRQKADWPALVANMVGRGAVATPEEAREITSYLTAHFGGE